MISSQVFKYGDNVDTDVIIPARYLNIRDAVQLATHCMGDIDSTFVARAKPGNIIVAGKNFGCGSSREHAPLAIKTVGIACVIAGSFARIFYRNAINIGLPILESEEAALAIHEGDLIAFDLTTGIIERVASDERWQAAPFPAFARRIIEAGGLLSARTQQQ